MCHATAWCSKSMGCGAGHPLDVILEPPGQSPTFHSPQKNGDVGGSPGRAWQGKTPARARRNFDTRICRALSGSSGRSAGDHNCPTSEVAATTRPTDKANSASRARSPRPGRRCATSPRTTSNGPSSRTCIPGPPRGSANPATPRSSQPAAARTTNGVCSSVASVRAVQPLPNGFDEPGLADVTAGDSV